MKSHRHDGSGIDSDSHSVHPLGSQIWERSPRTPATARLPQSVHANGCTRTHSSSLAAVYKRKVLYLFSGPAHDHDICKLREHFNIEIECVDVERAGDAHDLLNVEVWQALKKNIKDGKYVGLMVAPPRSTFSHARGLFVHGFTSVQPLRGDGDDIYG